VNKNFGEQHVIKLVGKQLERGGLKSMMEQRSITSRKTDEENLTVQLELFPVGQIESVNPKEMEAKTKDGK
jgi:hypothetical protein